MKTENSVPASLFANFGAWCADHWIALLIGALILLILFLVVIMPLIRKLRARRLKSRETSELKKDLQAWDNLHKLARGGEDAEQAKQNMSARIGAIDALFRGGMDMLGELNRKPYELPWFALLGEPASGKSALLQNSQMEIRASVEEEGRHAPEDSLPLRFWASPGAVVADISGRVFFDRWLEGSGAEWAHIVKLIRKKHAVRPLDGIILTVPADALLADDESLTRRKALLISSELNRLIRAAGMLLPCYVIVTKCDMLPGFREYFADSAEAFRDDIFGWNNEASGVFSSESFETFRRNTLTRLREGRRSRMLSRQVADASGSERGLAAGEIFSFPESFDSIQENLKIYLKDLFGSDNLHAAEKSLLSGVFFTSATDGGICLDRALAAASGKPVDEAVVVKSRNADRSGAFIHALLKKFIFPRRGVAEFTARERARRHIPLYLAILLLTGLGVFWTVAALTGLGRLESDLSKKAAYYNHLAAAFNNGGIAASPLIVPDGKGSWELTTRLPMKGDASILRINFFALEYDMLKLATPPPVGFKLASLLLFGPYSDLGYPEKARIHNLIQTQMVFHPALQATGEKLLKTPAEQPVSLVEGEIVMNCLEDMIPVEQTWYDRIFGWTGDEADYSARIFLQYVLPGMSEVSLSYFDSFVARHAAGSMSENIYLFFKDNNQAAQLGISRLMADWRDLSIYPDSHYSIARSALDSAIRLVELGKKIGGMKEPDSQASAESVGVWLKERKKLTDEYLALQKQVLELASRSDLLGGRVHFSGKSGAEPVQAASALDNARGEWRELFQRDYRAIRAVAEQRGGAMGAFNGKLTVKAVDAWRDEVSAKLDADEKRLGKYEENFYHLCSPVLFQVQQEAEAGADGDGHISPVSLFACVRSLSSSVYVEPPSGAFDFQKTWDDNEARIQEAVKKFDECAEKYAKEFERYPGLLECERTAMNLGIAYSRYRILDVVAKRLPDSKSTFSAEVVRFGPGKSTPAIDPALFRQALGKCEDRPDFNAAAVVALARDAALLIRCCTPDADAKKQENAPPVLLPDSTRVAAVRKGLDEYLKSFIDYWSGYPAKIGFHPADYADFRRQSALLKAYQTNSLLQNVYAAAKQNLASLPENVLSKETLQLRNDGIARLDAAFTTLNPHFTETCLRVVANWQALPAEPLDAWSKLTGQTSQKLKVDYLIVSGKREAGEIGWWTAYVTDAVETLRRAASAARAEKYADCIPMIRRFPLCADSGNPEPLASSDLKRFMEFLPSIGVFPVRGASGPEASADGKTEGKKDAAASGLELLPSDVLTPADARWTASVQTIAEALSNTGKPLRWTIVQLPEEMQKRMCATLAPGIASALPRFRYLTVSGDFSPRSDKVGTDGSEKAAELASGNASCDKLVFSFFHFSHETDPASEAVFSGGWAAVRLWLSPRAFYDPESKLLCVPLFLSDRAGRDYVYCVGLKFNKQLPPPELWPRDADAPEFSAVQEEIKRGSFTVADWKAEFLKAPADEAGYTYLADLVKPLNVGGLPKLSLRFAVEESGLDKYPSLLKYRFVRVRYSKGITPPVPTSGNDPGAGETQVSFIEPELTLALYAHSRDAGPAKTIAFQGPYALLKMLTSGRRFELPSGGIRVEIEANGEIIPVTVMIGK